MRANLATDNSEPRVCTTFDELLGYLDPCEIAVRSPHLKNRTNLGAAYLHQNS